MSIQLKRVETEKEKSFFIELLYSSFPISERRAEVRYEYLLSVDHPYYRPYIIMFEGEMAGIIDVWDYLSEGINLLFGEHIAILDKFKNNKIGSMTLLELSYKYDSFLLECELGNDEMSIRRLGMYDRIGAKIIKRKYAQPPLHRFTDYIPMHLLYFGELPSEENICLMLDTLYPLYYIDKITRDLASETQSIKNQGFNIYESDDDELVYIKEQLNKYSSVIDEKLKQHFMLWYSPSELGL